MLISDDCIKSRPRTSTKRFKGTSNVFHRTSCSNSPRKRQSEEGGSGGRRYLPYVFTEQGVAMLSSVLRSVRAVQVNIAIMRASVRMREVIATHKDLAREIEKLKQEQQKQSRQINQVFDVIEKLLVPPVASKRSIGFKGR